MDDDRTPLRVPISVAAERGISWLNDTAAVRRVILTKFGRPGAVIDSAERLDEAASTVEAARREVVAHFADAAGARTGTNSLEEACTRLGIDPARVRRRAAELRG